MCEWFRDVGRNALVVVRGNVFNNPIAELARTLRLRFTHRQLEYYQKNNGDLITGENYRLSSPVNIDSCSYSWARRLRLGGLELLVCRGSGR